MPLSERRQIENEMVFRRANEKIGDAIDDLDARNIEDDNPELISNDDLVLHFMCECSDEECRARIPIKQSVYRKIHENRNAFIVKLGHQISSIERVIHTEKDYNVVEKNKSTAEPGDKLNDTSASKN